MLTNIGAGRMFLGPAAPARLSIFNFIIKDNFIIMGNILRLVRFEQVQPDLLSMLQEMLCRKTF